MLGLETSYKLDKVRQKMLNYFDAEEIIFTSGATSANNFILRSPAFDYVITSSIEHKSVLNCLDFYPEHSALMCSTNRNGITTVDEDAIVKKFNDQAEEANFIISMMAVNSETGVIQPVESNTGQIIDILTELPGSNVNHDDIWVHCDLTQALGKLTKEKIQKIPYDFASISFHKIYGMKGIGALILKSNESVELIKKHPGLVGGGQQNGLWAGTENTTGIFAADAAMDFIETPFYKKRLEAMPELTKYIRRALPLALHELGIDMHFNSLDGTGFGVNNTINFSLMIEDEAIFKKYFDYMTKKSGFCFSSGSACNSGNPEGSYVVYSASDDRIRSRNTVRLSFTVYNTLEDVKAFCDSTIEYFKNGV
jgi:cysteine desulfurase